MRQRIVLLASVVLAGALASCAGYHTWPPIDGDTAFHNPNAPAMYDVMATATQWVVNRYPVDPNPMGGAGALRRGPDGAIYAVNLPEGMNAESYVKLLKVLGPEAAAITPETESLPTYHVARIWIRGDEAKVDVIRPLASLGIGPWGGAPAGYQGITVNLRGGLQPWTVQSHHAWAIGQLDVPARNYFPTPAAPAAEPAVEGAAPAEEPGAEGAYEMVDPTLEPPPGETPPPAEPIEMELLEPTEPERAPGEAQPR